LVAKDVHDKQDSVKEWLIVTTVMLVCLGAIGIIVAEPQLIKKINNFYNANIATVAGVIGIISLLYYIISSKIRYNMILPHIRYAIIIGWNLMAPLQAKPTEKTEKDKIIDALSFFHKNKG
jgi:hypothetical protein